MQLLELLESVTCEMAAVDALQNLSFYHSICLKEGRRERQPGFCGREEHGDPSINQCVVISTSLQPA